MRKQLAYVMINPYTLAKSRTGGVIGRFLSRTGLELAAARMFAPSRGLVEEYAKEVRQSDDFPAALRQLLADYILKAYIPTKEGLPKRVLMLLLEGEDAIQKVRDVAGPITMGGGETIRDTFGDYIVDSNNRVQYFEPAVLVGANIDETATTLKLWARHSATDGGILTKAVDVSRKPGWQMTLVLIKPDNFRFPTARPGNIIDMFSRSGLRIIAAKVHRMSVGEAQEFYKPVKLALREKMKSQAAEKSKRALEAEFKMDIPDSITRYLEKQLGPLLGDEKFNEIVKFMTGCSISRSAPEAQNKDGRLKCLALVYSGVKAVEKIRKLLGTTDPSKAQPGSVRREFGHDIMVNAAHASDSEENASREISILHIEEDTINKLVKQHYG